MVVTTGRGGGPPARPDDREAPSARGDLPAVSSAVLMAGGREIVILHGGDRYRLRITANDKLILTK